MKRMLVILLILCLLPLSSCAAAEKREGLVAAIPQDPDYLDPHRAVASGTEEVMFNLFEGLMKAKPDGTLDCALAVKYEISPDALIYRFTIREGVLFHDGKPLRPEDVLFSYRRLSGSETGKPLLKALKDVTIEQQGQDIIFTLPKPNSSFLEEMTRAILPADLTDEEYNTKPIGTGPYQFVSYEPTRALKMKRFESYWNEEKKGHIEEVEFRIFADNNSAFTSLLAGEVDLLTRLTTKQLQSLPEAFVAVEGPQNLIQILAFNLKDELLQKTDVRQAIAMAVDKEALKEIVADGKATLLGSNMSPVMSYWYEGGLEARWPHDVEKAKRILSEQGVSGMNLTVTVPSNYDFHVKTAEVLVEQLQKAGIQAQIELVEWGVWLERVYKNRDFQSTIIAFTGKLDPHAVLGRYESHYASNFMNYGNPEVDRLLGEALQEQDQEKRATLYKEVQRILAEDLPALYLMDPNYIVGLKKNLKGFTLYPIYVLDVSTLSFE